MRDEIEMKYARKRESIDEAAAKAQRKLEDKRVKDQAKNTKVRHDELFEAGLNPDGSHPQGRPQGSIK